jgi:hypothetical protein
MTMTTALVARVTSKATATATKTAVMVAVAVAVAAVAAVAAAVVVAAEAMTTTISTTAMTTMATTIASLTTIESMGTAVVLLSGQAPSMNASAPKQATSNSTDAQTYAPSSSVEDGGTTFRPLFDCCVVVDWDQAARLLSSTWSQNRCV